jgi:hypothetical protein
VSPLAQSIRFWLMRRPRPVKVRLHAGKEVSEIETGAGVSWARVAETVDSMDATKLEALSETGALIRACKPDELAEPDDDADEPAPAAPVVVPFDAETERWKLFATLLDGAYKHANEQAFATLAGIVERMARRDEATSRAIERIRDGLLREAEDRYANATEAAGGAEGGVLAQAAAAFLGGMGQGKAEAAANGAAPTNGKGH